MLGLAEYRAAAAVLEQIGLFYDDALYEALSEDGLTKVQKLAIARTIAAQYSADYQDALEEALTEVAENAVSYYGDKLNLSPPDYEGKSEEIVSKQYTARYYGATLAQRLAVNRRVLGRRMAQAINHPDPEAVGKVFHDPVPHGSQTATDRRLMLGTMSKIEQDVAKEMASLAGVELIRWTLSGRHKLTCECEDLARAVSPAVVNFMRENDIQEDPKGLYLVKDLPLPPHPNCQCEYGMVVGDKTQARTPIRRTVERIKSLLRRLKR